MDFDHTYVFTDISTARQLLDLHVRASTTFNVTLQDVTEAHSVALILEESLGQGILARSTFEIYRGLFA